MTETLAPKRIKVVLICMLDSIHAARWLSQFTNEEIDFVVLPSTPNRNIHSILRKLMSSKTSKASYEIPWMLQYLAIPLWGIDLLLKNRVRGLILSMVARKNSADFVHALELNHAGYIALRGYKFGFPSRTRLIATNWGSDIYWFQQFGRHKRQIEELMAISSSYSAECNRDLALASSHGFRGEFHEVFPNAGGFSIKELNRVLSPPSQRNVILIKGYESFVGRASIALESISRIAEEIRPFEIVLYSANRKTIKLSKKIGQEFGLDIRAIPKKKLTHDEMIELFSISRAYLGVSLSDGISTSLLEAMMCGAFPIQTNTSCADEWITSGVTGLIVDPNADQVERALLEAIHNDEMVNEAAEINVEICRERLNSKVIKEKARRFYIRD
jgi:glycosyltransferase involved in cell wall biosynthesis